MASSEQGSRPPSLARLFLVLALGLVASATATSCLTPEATFDDGDGDSDSGIGGDSGDGDAVSMVDHCSNRSVDADETDTDCGGRDCEPCELGRSCSAGADCVNGTCTEGTCQMPSCTDRVKNSGETDVDCGGDGCPPCGDGSVCQMNADCESVSCRGGECAVPTCSDRIRNGNESDVDCGGDCQPCESGASCAVTADCVQPPAEDPSTTVCEDGICTLLCGTGLGDCNQQAGDGCETNLNTSATHCGACGDTCSPDNAIGECLGGTCLIKRDEPNGGCVGTWQDCNSMDDDGCEANVNNDASHCGACDQACSNANGTPSCSGGTCSISCESGFDDCDANARDNGCEIATDSNAMFCGGCEPSDDCPDGNATQSPFCDMGICGLTDCPAGLGDCDGDNECTDDLSRVDNCGGCGTVCSVTNGTPSCTDPGGGSECGISTCDSGGGEVWNDCDGDYVNGCEVDTESSKFRCGGCLPSDDNAGSGENCTDIESDGSKHVTATECSAGGCSIVGCDTGYADCNGVFSDGCEVNTATDDDNCGGCTAGPTTTWDGGFVCDNLYENGTGTCSDSTCSFDDCETDYGDCNGDAALGDAGDGCEEFLVGNDDHCGVCDNACLTNAATSGNACTASGNRACSPTCANPSNNGNCDGNGANGCETQLQVSEPNCGTCGNNCTDSIGNNNISQVDCVTGGCEVLTCNSNRADCDGTFSNGCEVNMNNNETHCGGCTSGSTTEWDGGENCNNKIGNDSVTGVNCGSGSCEVQTCGANRADCDGSFGNGCEVNTSTSTTHCGGCTSGPTSTWDGGESCAAKSNATVACSSGSCLWACETGWKDSNGDLQAGSSNGCETAVISVVNEDTTAGGKDAAGDLSFTHTLQTARSTNSQRTVAIIIGFDGNNVGLPPPVRYNGTLAAAANRVVRYSGNQSWAGIYWFLDSQLPASTGSYTVLIDGNQHNTQNWTANVLELINIDQSSPTNQTQTQGAGGSPCNADLTVNTNADAFVLSALNVQAGSQTYTPTSGQTPTAQVVSGSANTIGGYFLEVGAGSRRVQWGCSDSEWAHVLVSFNPEGTD